MQSILKHQSSPLQIAAPLVVSGGFSERLKVTGWIFAEVSVISFIVSGKG
jgi:hypothetical protein